MLMRAGRERDERVRARAHKGQTAIAEQFYRFAQESEALGHGRETARGTLAHEEVERVLGYRRTNIEDWPEAKAWIGVDHAGGRDQTAVAVIEPKPWKSSDGRLGCSSWWAKKKWTHTAQRQADLDQLHGYRQALDAWLSKPGCPSCGGDLTYPNPRAAYYSDPLQYDVACRCGWTGRTTVKPPK